MDGNSLAVILPWTISMWALAYYFVSLEIYLIAKTPLQSGATACQHQNTLNVWCLQNKIVMSPGKTKRSHLNMSLARTCKKHQIVHSLFLIILDKGKSISAYTKNLDILKLARNTHTLTALQKIQQKQHKFSKKEFLFSDFVALRLIKTSYSGTSLSSRSAEKATANCLPSVSEGYSFACETSTVFPKAKSNFVYIKAKVAHSNQA